MWSGRVARVAGGTGERVSREGREVSEGRVVARCEGGARRTVAAQDVVVSGVPAIASTVPATIMTPLSTINFAQPRIKLMTRLQELGTTLSSRFGCGENCLERRALRLPRK